MMGIHYECRWATMNSAPPSKELLRPVLCEATVVSPPEVLADRSKNPKWPNSFLIMHLMCPWLSRVGSRIFCLGSRSSDHSPRTHLGFQAMVPQDGARLRRRGWGKQLPTTLSPLLLFLLESVLTLKVCMGCHTPGTVKIFSSLYILLR